MYNSIIVNHFSNPRNVGELTKKSHVIKIGNPVCDDQISMDLDWDENFKICDVKYRAYGCATSIATASLFSEFARGKTLSEIAETPHTTIEEMLGDLEPSQMHCLELLKSLVSDIRKAAETPT